MFYHAEQLFLKYFPALEASDTVQEMHDNFRTSEYIMEIISDKENHPHELLPIRRLKRDQFKEKRRLIYRDLEQLVGLELVEQIQAMDLPLNGLHTDWGAIACWEYRKRAFLALAKLVYQLCKKMGGPDAISYFIPQMRNYYAAVDKGTGVKVVEEKMVLQAIVCAAFSGLSFQELQEYVDVGMAVAGLHFATTLNPQLNIARQAKTEEWKCLHTAQRMEQLRLWMDEALAKKERVKFRLVPETPYVKGDEFFSALSPTPLFQVPSDYWRCVIGEDDNILPGSVLSGSVPLKPIHPKYLSPLLLPHHKSSVEVGCFGKKGSGKTTLCGALDTYWIRKGYVIVQPTIRREQALLCCLPALPVNAQAKEDLQYLEKLKIRPQAVPTKFVTVCEKLSQLPRQDTVWTIHDEIIFVRKLNEFELDWNMLLRDFSRGELIFRHLRSERDTNIMRASLIRSFFNWRELHRERKLALGVDEFQDVLMAEVTSAQDAQIKGAATKVLGDIRGMNLPFRFSAIRPAMLQPEALEMCTSIFFSELGASGAEESRSTKGRIMKVIAENLLSDRDKLYLPLVERIMANRPLARKRLFFWVVRDQPLRLVSACLPPFMSEITDMDLHDVFSEAEKLLDQRILVDVSEVPHYEASERLSEKVGVKASVEPLIL